MKVGKVLGAIIVWWKMEGLPPKLEVWLLVFTRGVGRRPSGVGDHKGRCLLTSLDNAKTGRRHRTLSNDTKQDVVGISFEPLIGHLATDPATDRSTPVLRCPAPQAGGSIVRLLATVDRGRTIHRGQEMRKDLCYQKAKRVWPVVIWDIGQD